MGNRSSLLLREEEIQQIQQETGCKYLRICIPPFVLCFPDTYILVYCQSYAFEIHIMLMEITSLKKHKNEAIECKSNWINELRLSL